MVPLLIMVFLAAVVFQTQEAVEVEVLVTEVLDLHIMEAQVDQEL